MSYRTLMSNLIAAVLLGLLASAPAVLAYGDGTPDTAPPAEETWCDGLGGRLWGLCVAYCEAQDCPASQHPSCDRLRERLYDLTGYDLFPCDSAVPGLQ